LAIGLVIGASWLDIGMTIALNTHKECVTMQRFVCPLECRDIKRGGIERIRNVREYADHLERHKHVYPSLGVAAFAIRVKAKVAGLDAARELAQFVQCATFRKGE
jgi:hypothetical protein